MDLVVGRASMRLVLVVLIAAVGVEASAQTPAWSSGPYVYDSAGNVVSIGLDRYQYDTAGRLVSATAAEQQTHRGLSQSYVYDSFGNRRTASTCVGQTCTSRDLNVDPRSNHNDGTTYNADGAIESRTGANAERHYQYDASGMLSVETAGVLTRQFIYTAADERIAVHDGSSWLWSVRDLSKRVARDVTSNDDSSQWTPLEDYVYSDAGLDGSLSNMGRRHVHNDHLSTARVVTDDERRRVGDHAYYAFGEGVTIADEQPQERLRYTGHERDASFAGESLDYMHARYYDSANGRFMSMDSHGGYTRAPQTWNRYAYARNSPMRKIDPDGNEPLDSQMLLFFNRFFHADFSNADVVSSPVDFGWRGVMFLGNGVTVGNHAIISQGDADGYARGEIEGMGTVAHELIHTLHYSSLGLETFLKAYTVQYSMLRIAGYSNDAAMHTIWTEQIAYYLEKRLKGFLTTHKSIRQKLARRDVLTKADWKAVDQELSPTKCLGKCGFFMKQGQVFFGEIPGK